MNNEPFVVIDKEWLFGLSEARSAQSMGCVLSGVRNQINDMDKVAAVELGKGYRPPEALCEWWLEKNDVLAEACQCLTDSQLIKALRASNILRTYQFTMELRDKP